MTDDHLDIWFTRRTADQKAQHQNFVTYVAGQPEHRCEMRVRVNCKYQPWDTKVTCPYWMEH
eukprot:9419486-Karenia_brevis.AAC.1